MCIYLNCCGYGDVSKDVPGDLSDVLRHAEEAEAADEPVETDGECASAKTRRPKQRQERSMLDCARATHLHAHLLSCRGNVVGWTAVSGIKYIFSCLSQCIPRFSMALRCLWSEKILRDTLLDRFRLHFAKILLLFCSSVIIRFC